MTAFTSRPGNYTLGRGRVHFAAFLPGTRTPGPRVYFGNTPEFKINQTSETLEHFSSEAGVKEVDDAATIKTTRKFTLKTDNISNKNMALYFLGRQKTTTLTAGVVAAEVIPATQVESDAAFQLGQTAQNPSGSSHISAGTVVIKAGLTTYVEGTDYEVNYLSGAVHIMPTGSIVSGVALTADYHTDAVTYDSVVSGATSIEGRLVFESDNPTGTNNDYICQYVRLSPQGDFALKGDVWQEMDFQGEIIKLGSMDAVEVRPRA